MTDDHCTHCLEHDRILRGDGNNPGLQEQVRSLSWLPEVVKKLERGDVIQGAISEAVLRILFSTALVIITAVITKWLL